MLPPPLKPHLEKFKKLKREQPLSWIKDNAFDLNNPDSKIPVLELVHEVYEYNEVFYFFIKVLKTNKG